MLDTNVLISALILHSKTIDRVIKDIAINQELLLSTFVIDEFKAVVALKWPDRKEVVDDFLQRASYEMVAVKNHEGYLIFHAMTPPSPRTLIELNLQGR